MTDNTATKTCPDCAEKIRAAAQKCRFCGCVFSASTGTDPRPRPAALDPLSAETYRHALRRMTPVLVLGGLFFVGLIVCDSYNIDSTVPVLLGAAFFIVVYRLMRASSARIRDGQDARIVCAQCHSTGCVTTSIVTLKKGISGGKATGAILTGGLSLLAVGLSRKEEATEARCSNCGSVWHF